MAAKSTRYAHCEGHTDLCFDESGNHMLTCGSDGDVRIWKNIDDDDPVSHRAGDVVFAVACKNERFFTATDDNAVKAFMLKDGHPDGVLVRFTAPVSHMVFNKEGTTLFAGSSDFYIKVVEVSGSSQKLLHGHEAPVLGLALHPNEQLLASSSCDGTVKIWKLEDQSVVKSLQLLPKTNDVTLSPTLCRLCWSKSGKHLAIPMDKEIHVYNCQDWTLAFKLTDPNLKEFISLAAFSPCGKYLAGSSRNGSIHVWDFNSKSLLVTEKHDKGAAVTALVWNPKGNNELAYCDDMGNLGVIEDLVTDVQPEQQTESSAQFADLFDDDDDMIVEASGAIEEEREAEQLAGDSDDDIPQTGKQRVARIDEDSVDTDMMSKDGDDADSELGLGTEPAAPAPKTVYTRRPEPPQLQKAFQPGSTPVHLSHRFMMWNSVGIVRQYNTEEENSIDIEFHDTSVHHAMHVTNSLNHTMAALSQEAVLLACESDEENPSKLVCMHFGSWDSCKEWTVPMPPKEDIQAVTLGDGWLAVATSQRRVRVFTVGGVQLEMFNIPGPVVAMAAHTTQLLIAYHQGPGLPGDQNLGVILLHVKGKKRAVCKGDPLPIAHKSTLAWLGFSAEGTPFSADSSGCVYMMNRKLGNSWTQVANTKKHCKGKSDHCFLVGIHENPQQLRCIPCKGSQYPPTLPRPTVSILPFELPLCELATDKGQLEETYLRSVLFHNYLEFWSAEGFELEGQSLLQAIIPQQEALMKSFALACKSEREFRAVELCTMMPSHHAVQLAIKYASRLRHLQLAQRLSEVAREKAEEEGQEEEEEDETNFNSQIQTRFARTSLPSRRNGQTASLRQSQQAKEQEADEKEDVEENMEEEDLGEEEEMTSKGPMLNLKPSKSKVETPTSLSQSGLRKNPFKSCSQASSTPQTSSRGSSVFDSMQKSTGRSSTGKSPISDSKTTPKLKVRDQKKGPSQMTLFGKKKNDSAESAENTQPSKVKSKTTGFQLWFEENQTALQEEHPDLDDGELTLTAAKQFKQLPNEEKQEWNKKAAEQTGKSEPEKKRKRPADTDSEVQDSSKETNSAKRKKPLETKSLSQNTNSKLAGFAFKS